MSSLYHHPLNISEGFASRDVNAFSMLLINRVQASVYDLSEGLKIDRFFDVISKAKFEKTISSFRQG